MKTLVKSRGGRGSITGGRMKEDGGHAKQNGVWTEEEDLLLAEWQKKVGNKWSEVAKQIPGKTGQQCAQRWRHRVNPAIKRDKWDEDEDELLTALVQKYGNAWAEIARHVPGRTDQQCMGRWKRHLDPSIKREKWSDGEDIRLCALYAKYDNAWSSISRALDGRTPQQCRTRWHNLKATSFMTRRQKDIRSIDIDAVEKAAIERIETGKHYLFAGVSASPIVAEEDKADSPVLQKLYESPQDDVSSDDGARRKRKRKRGRPFKTDAQQQPIAGVDRTAPRARGRPRKHFIVPNIAGMMDLQTPPVEAGVGETTLSFLDQAIDHRSQRGRTQRRLSFESTVDALSALERDSFLLDTREYMTTARCGKRRRVMAPDSVLHRSSARDDSWTAQFDEEPFNSQPIDTHDDADEGIMLPINGMSLGCPSPFANRNRLFSEPAVPLFGFSGSSNSVAMTPPKPKSKRQLLEGSQQRNYHDDLNFGFDDIIGQDIIGNKTPLSALRHAPKSCFSPALVDLLRSPPVSHEKSHIVGGGLQGFVSPHTHGRAQQFWNSGNMTPPRNHVSDVVRCLDPDIEWAGDRNVLDFNQGADRLLDSVCKDSNPFGVSVPPRDLTPGTIGMHPPLVLDSTPRLQSGSVMMKGNTDMSRDLGPLSIPKYVSVDPTDGQSTKLLPVQVFPQATSYPLPDHMLQASAGGENAIAHTSFNLFNKMNANPLPSSAEVEETFQNEVLKTRTRRLSSASVRMCLHALLENA